MRVDERRKQRTAARLDHIDAGRRVERLAERGDLAVAHEHVEVRVDALARIEHARAAHEHAGSAPGRLGQPPWLAPAHAAASGPASRS